MPHATTRSARALTLVMSTGFLLLAACDADDPTSPLEAHVAFNAAMGKTDVCHRTTNGNFSKISVADAAYETHIAHGDGGIGDPVPGMAGYIFDDACQPELGYCPLEIVAGSVTICDIYSPAPRTLHVRGRNLLDMQYLELHAGSSALTGLKNINGCGVKLIENDFGSVITWTNGLITVTASALAGKTLTGAHVSWGGYGLSFDTCFWLNPWVKISFPPVPVAP